MKTFEYVGWVIKSVERRGTGRLRTSPMGLDPGSYLVFVMDGWTDGFANLVGEGRRREYESRAEQSRAAAGAASGGMIPSLSLLGGAF